jgi:hypothetical protein
VPNQLGVDYNTHVIEANLKYVVPGSAGGEGFVIPGRPQAGPGIQVQVPNPFLDSAFAL